MVSNLVDAYLWGALWASLPRSWPCTGLAVDDAPESVTTAIVGRVPASSRDSAARAVAEAGIRSVSDARALGVLRAGAPFPGAERHVRAAARRMGRVQVTVRRHVIDVEDALSQKG